MTRLLIYTERTDGYGSRVRTQEIICPDAETAEEYLDRYTQRPDFLDYDIVD